MGDAGTSVKYSWYAGSSYAYVPEVGTDYWVNACLTVPDAAGGE